ncbi:sigma-70 family RNA polymerase sigma factor [uncultured Mobiluncus sp.]|uniref:sigma-70 family RNA polymerase sigma factor n=1 Tax=uncultured Mobiluncus sp. TaxID=293425 RepID=UPI00260ADCA8|nr:sigma-70 family RNA polymerase sigma factor [uncultured Mobiluncus sp.]
MEASLGEVNRNELIEKNLPLVGYQVAELLRRVPSFVQREDLASAGSLALVQAANSYDPSTGVPFHRYAIYRIRGAMLDELRSMDWATRGARQRTKQLEEMTSTLTAASGRAPTKEELASALGVDVEAVESAQQDAARRVISMDAPAGKDDERTLEVPDESPSPEDTLLDDERLVYLRAAVRALPQRLRYVVEQVFFEERPIQDVADELGVTQSRVSQLRSEALTLMREGMNRHLDPETAAEENEEVTGIVKKRRENYFQKIEDHADEMLRADSDADFEIEDTLIPPPDSPSARGLPRDSSRAPRPRSSSLRDSLSQVSSGGPAGSSRRNEKEGKSSAEDSSGTSTKSFLAGHARGTAQAKARLEAEQEAKRAAEEAQKPKSKDKVRSRGGEPEVELTAEEEKPPAPPTTSYLGGLSIRQQNMRAEARRNRRKK